MEAVVLHLVKLTATVEALSLDVVAISKITRTPTARNAPQCKLPISKGVKQPNEELRDENFLARLVSKLTLFMHGIPSLPLYIVNICSLLYSLLFWPPMQVKALPNY